MTEATSANKKILIVEDDATLRASVVLKLKSRGYETVEAMDGTSALAAVKTQNPDLIILDIVLPGELDGLAIMKEIRASDQEKPIILLSNLDPDGKVVESINKDHPTYYFIKSNTSISELADKIDGVFEL